MRDVLSVLQKLPPSCLVWAEGRAYIIHRGVMGLHEHPTASELQVVVKNHSDGITLEQVEAMKIGATLGWETEGADLKPVTGNTTFVYSAPVQVLLSVNANHEADAAPVAVQALNKLIEYLQDTSHDHILTVVRDGKIDLIEENKNDDAADVQPD